ncbi:unnamed protein product [Chrysodeixis includens]|uniref:MGA conserved domain-containing protein n=1 Tax=Chrysodeixis includens TaxID=689277 RepID=A0A9P0FWZ3_CHRIL|nr:unnamed protein product [Chrysodeixis includens]
MENDAKVFASNITRAKNNHNNNLYDLLNIIPAKPQRPTASKTHNCDFKPQTDKYYIPKRKQKLKVKTVGDIRKTFEQDTYSYLSNDLESQHKLLFKRIKRGSSKNDETKSLARSLIKLDKPVFRSTWEMLINLNPEQYAHPRQFVIWNGRHIQVNGSHGGCKKILCNYDLANEYLSSHNINENICNFTTINKKRGLIRHSLAVKFKPGPLRKKKNLDQSHQRYYIGNAELIGLPKPGLDIQPTYGTALESTLNNYLNSFRQEDGTITQKWAELAVSVLGKVEKSNVVQLNKDCVTFEVNYKYNRQRILMRRDKENVSIKPTVKESDSIYKNIKVSEHNVLPEVEDIMSKILNSVEISLSQDELYNKDKDESNFLDDLNSSCTETNVKPKKRYCELGRLDVTVITVPEIEKQEVNKCIKAHCKLGCICMSIDGTQNLRQHCGRAQCMFECKCGNKGGFLSLRDDDLECISNLDKKMNLTLAKEEQKFHQTVIVTGEKQILLKAERRNCKIPEKYAEYYGNICNKQESRKNRVLSIVLPKFNFENVEPWCMVHKLYKCFCKGRFTDSGEIPNEGSETSPLDHSVNVTRDQYINKSINSPNSSRLDLDDQTNRKDRSVTPVQSTESMENTSVVDGAKYRTRLASRNLKSHSLDSKIQDDCEDRNEEVYTCARIMPYEGRKFSDGYYRNTNSKIIEMEKNDKRLQDRLAALNQDQQEAKSKNKRRMSTTIDSSILDMLYKEDEITRLPTLISENMTSRLKRKRLCNKTELVNWLETNYKLYKERSDQGLIKKSLEPPQVGKIVLHSWEFILNRYREQKNLFLISQQKPFRIFMAVHTRHPFFENCMNINDIRFADLHKYPQTVKNLLINATDLKDFFCILRGLTVCWELVGSVAKINEDQDGQGINVESSGKETFVIYENEENMSLETCNEKEVEDNHSKQKQIESSTEISEESISSKWFVMTIENDFSEIRFPDKGFFVTHTSIMKVICMARLANKTVRLSSRQCVEESENPSFGIYAMPNTNENCVLVGPYELKDPLGIETVKTFLDLRRMKATRGFWMKTSKVDNLQVVENPLSFMSLANPQSEHSIPLDSHCSEEGRIDQSQIFSENLDKTEEPKQSDSPQKVVKPIKIRKTNGFYHLASDGMLKRIALPPNLAKAMPVVLNKCLNTENGSVLQPASSNMKIVQFSPLKTNAMTTPSQSNMNTSPIQSNVSTSPLQSNDSSTPPRSIVMTPPLQPRVNITPLQSTVNTSPSQSNVNITPLQSNDITMSLQSNVDITPILTDVNTSPSQSNTNVTPCQSNVSTPFVVITPEKRTVEPCLLENQNSPNSGLKQERMFVLKPEEINRKLFQESTTFMATAVTPNEYCSDESSNADSRADTSETECLVATNDDVYVISDDDESISEFVKDVWIESTNVRGLGWIAGRRNRYKLLSFKFPGYDYSKFYIQDRAFAYINLKLCELTNSSMSQEIKWKVIESPQQLSGNELDLEQLLNFNVLTKDGQQLTSYALMTDRNNLRTYKKKPQKITALSPCFQPSLFKNQDTTAQINLPDPKGKCFQAKKGELPRQRRN